MRAGGVDRNALPRPFSGLRSRHCGALGGGACVTGGVSVKRRGSRRENGGRGRKGRGKVTGLASEGRIWAKAEARKDRVSSTLPGAARFGLSCC